VFTFSKHKCEGYALDWSPVRAGRLASGDCDKAIHVWDVEHGGSSVSVDPAAYLEHQGSVEDLQWSPTEESVFASCSTDGAVKIWDVRAKNRSMLTQNAHEVDVNVISWNRKVAYLLASGSDDCSFKVWDLRQLSATKQADPVGMFKGFHTDAITSIEWR
jgi:ribosome assembly protein RRB1